MSGGAEPYGPVRSVRLLGPQEQWLQEVLAEDMALTAADFVRWCVDVAYWWEKESRTAPPPMLAHRRSTALASKHRLKTCVGCHVTNEDVRECCDHPDALPTCPLCYVTGRGNHAEHGLLRDG